jgi:Flp pilus assembly protein TadD
MRPARIQILLIVMLIGSVALAGCTAQKSSDTTSAAGGDTATIFAQADTLGEQGNYQQALTAYDQGLQIDPNNIEALNGKGATLRALGRDDEALAVFTRATEVDPSSAPSWMNRGDALERLGRTTEADAAYKKATDLGGTAQQ